MWYPPGDDLLQLQVTGYMILWFSTDKPQQISNMTVGNVTTSSVRGLKPATQYVFSIAAMSEGAYNGQAATLPTDLYGRRAPAPGALVGTFSDFSLVVGTLSLDFQFQYFDANATLNSSGSTPSTSDGPTGLFGSEGQYGLYIVGSAHVENCNSSFTCCDGYNPAIGYRSCRPGPSVCAFLLSRSINTEFVIDGQTRQGVPSNALSADGISPPIVVMSLDELFTNKGAPSPSASCGPSLRLTPSVASQSGAVWYRRKENVYEGFDTTFRFEISNPSFVCDRLNDVNTRCRSRGADGLAFVLQDVSPTALGLGGSGLGYEGIFNSLAIEVDTYFNYDQLDFYENHVSILTQVRRLWKILTKC